MRTAASILFELAGHPEIEGCSPISTPCAVCGAPCVRGLDYERWQGAQFTDQTKLRSPGASHVCEPCVWAHAWNVPPGYPIDPAKPKGPNLRMFSHFWDAHGYWYGHKGDRGRARDWLRAPKTGEWFAVIAESGQKHTLPWAPVNPAGARSGRIRFEERTVALGDFALVDEIEALIAAKITRDEITAGEYGSHSWRRSASLVGAFEARWGRARGSGWFALALWLAPAPKKEE